MGELGCIQLSGWEHVNPVRQTGDLLESLRVKIIGVNQSFN